MLEGISWAGKRQRFAPTPWTTSSQSWQALEDRLPLGHLARQVDEAVDMLDLDALFASYMGVGKLALRPELLLKLVLYEMQSKRPSPAQWARDVRESEPVRWLLQGLEPSRSRLYDFRDRIAPFLPQWNAQVLQLAVDEQITSAKRVALDSTTVAANASRRKVLNEERLQKRRGIIEEALQCVACGKAIPNKPGWLANTEIGLREQQRRYQRAAEVMRQRQATNARRIAGKRRPAEKILVSSSDPDAILARDKLNVFRPLYTVQLLRDIDTSLILAYDVVLKNNENGVLEPMIERMINHVEVKPVELFVDSGYVSLHDLEFCAAAGITLYGPYQENDYSKKTKKKAQSNQHALLPKSSFLWLPQEQAYQCPEGHLLRFTKAQMQRRTDYSVKVFFYRCDPTHCQICPRRTDCTTAPDKGRSIGRMENEDLLDALRQRMDRDDVKLLYKLRSQTVELNFADLKEHRGLRRFHSRGLSRVTTEVAALVLIHNLLSIDIRHRAARAPPADHEIRQSTCPA
jgi:transposase